MKFFPLIAALLAFSLAATAQETSALRQQHEKELEAARHEITRNADNAALANALKKEAVALNLLGRSDEALAQLQQAASLAPDNLSVKMQAAVVLDYLGRHGEAADIYADLSKKIQDWNAAHTKARKAGGKPKPSAQDADLLGVSFAITTNAAFNNIFRNKPDQALAQFTGIYETRNAAANPDKYSDYAASWRVWLTAKFRADEGMRASTAIDTLTKTLNVSTPYHAELLKLWRGKGHWQKILSAIDGMKISDAEKEACLTEARFFAAGYYRYVKRDNATALELLDAENARPFNGCIERLFIRKEIEELRK